MPLPAGTRLGSYTIERLLGAGGMGEVYLAHDSRLGREVALKILPADVAADSDRRTRFEREARLAAALHHAHICTIYEVGEADGQPFIAMEYVEGTTLRDRVRVDLFSLKETLDIAIQIADALDEARQRKIVHRDLKSANILLTPQGDVKILDFGLAKRMDEVRAHDATTEGGVTDAGLVIGTAAYMSPEQALGQPLDHRSDLFSFGVVLYELLTGRLPFTGKTTMELFSAILHGTPQPIPRFNEQVPDPLVRVVGKLLEKDREQRYQSAREVVTDLRKIRDEGATAATVAPAATRWSPRRLWTAIVVCTILVAAGVTWWSVRRPGSTTGVPTVLVLPADFYGDQAFVYLADSVARQLSTRLADVPEIETKVSPSKVEVDQFKGDIQRVVAIYGATEYIRPTLLVQAGHLKLTLELVDSRTRVLKHSLEYDGSTSELDGLIANAASGMRGVLAPAAAAPNVIADHTNSDARLAHERGLWNWNRFNNLHEQPDFDLALESLTRALELDSHMGDAAAELAYLYVFRREADWSPEQAQPYVAKWADRARQINDATGGRSPLAWSALATAENMKPSPDLARGLQYALKGAYGASRSAIAQNELIDAPIRALKNAAVQEAHRLDPAYAPGTGNLAFSLFLAERSEETLTVLDSSPDAGSPFLLFTRIEALADLGRLDEAQRLLQQLLGQADKLPEVQTLIARYQVLAQRRDPGADALLAQFMTILRDHPFACNGAEDMLPFLGRNGRTAEGIQILKTCTMPYDWLSTDRRLAAFRQDPQFEPLVANARRQFMTALEIFDDFARRGGLPKYLVQPLADLHRRMKM